MTIRDRVLAETRRWIGTPYRHQGFARGVGCDCLGLVRGIWAGVYGCEAERPPAYAMDWAVNAHEDRMAQAAARNMTRIATGGAQPGDLILFSWKPGYPACHAGILFPENRFVHAYERAGVVCSPLVPHWRRRITATFTFKDNPENL